MNATEPPHHQTPGDAEYLATLEACPVFQDVEDVEDVKDE